MKVNKEISPVATILFFFINSFAFAQDPASPDSNFAGTFNAFGTVRAIKVQTDGKILVAGDFTNYKATPVNRIVRLNPDGTIDNTFNVGTGANSGIFSIALQANGKILIGGNFTSFNGINRERIARLNTDGSVDTTFNSGILITSTVRVITLQPDGKILLGGNFTGVDKPKYITRLLSDGTLDNTFNPGSGPSGGGGNGTAIYSVVLQQDGKILIGGSFTSFSGVTQNCLVRLNISGSVDNTFNIGSGPYNSGGSMAVFSLLVESDGKIIVGGFFDTFNGVYKPNIVRLMYGGSLDTGFNANSYISVFSLLKQSDGKIIIGGAGSCGIKRIGPGGDTDNTFTCVSPSGNQSITMALQSDGKIIVGGDFTTSFINAPRVYFARLNSNGSIDNSFIGSGANGTVLSVITQKDRKILIGGSFTLFNLASKNRLVRLNPEGSLDNLFNIGSGANNTIRALCQQPDWKILAGGDFTFFNGSSKNRLVRLNPNGSIDNSFNIGSGANNLVYSIVLQSDEKILVGGGFTSFNSVSKSYIIRLNSDGSIDNSFNPGTGPNGAVYSIIIQPDEKIMLGGAFTSYNGIACNYMIRLNPDGSIDDSFIIGAGTNNAIYSMALQPDGKIILGGNFTTVKGVSKNRIARLNPDGSIDNTFINSGANNTVNTITLHPNGKIFAGGLFTSFNGLSRNRFICLNSNGTVDNGLNMGFVDQAVHSITLEADGKILVGGGFSYFKSISYNHMVRVRGYPIFHNIISGFIFNSECNQPVSVPLPSVIVKALPGPYFASSDIYGRYEILVDSGSVNYTVSQDFNLINSEILSQCIDFHNVSLTGASKDTCCFNFIDSVKQCALLKIDVQSLRMRRCFRSSTFIDYCNLGNGISSNTQVRVEYPDYVVPLSSVPMWSSKQGSVLFYDIGVLVPGTCNRIIISDSVVCGNESIRGLTQCIRAYISPASNCTPANPAWDRSSIQVTGKCENGVVRFSILNAGSASMDTDRDFRVYVNDTLIYSGIFQLTSGDSLIISYPAEGQTIRIEADQHYLHPGRSLPRATIENCGNSSSGTNMQGFVTTAPQDDLNTEVSVTCNRIIDSYDPNDKLSLPEGVGIEKRIEPGQELEYVIRFQNTGTDTAYTVRIIDTLDIALNPGFFTEGVSSHPYTLKITGKGKAVVGFNFYNINLPDSTANEPASNGLVSFRVTVPVSTPLGTVITNKAYIFFDYNSPIITNETMHTVNITVDEDFSKGTLVQEGTIVTNTFSKKGDAVRIYPNPTYGVITIVLSENSGNSSLQIYSLMGVMQKEYILGNAAMQEVNLEGLNQGMYVYRVVMEGEVKGRGMVRVK